MKKLIMFATIAMISVGAFAAEERAAVARKPVNPATGTHHCQDLGNGKANCVNWANGKYNRIQDNCNELTCKRGR